MPANAPMATSRVTTRDNLKEAETSPDGRYVRFDEKLGNGAYKDVWLSYDTETGKEVAWNAVDLRRMPNIERKRIRSETEILKSLSHPHIINFYHVWDNAEKDQICFTTEIVTSGTLKQYTSRVKCVKLKVIKKWCRQILAGLDYLHSHNPPIIHRDLKCDNIFINGSTGEIRIGDFGLSTARHKTHTESVLGTPEFMAPELYDEHYSEKVDIYAFGMCVLEMTTKEYPYEECMNAAQIWKRVSAGQKPDVLNRIKDPQVRAFLDLCLMPQQFRLSAHDLLKHPFLSFKHCDPIRDNIAVAVEERKNLCEEDENDSDDPTQRTRDILEAQAKQKQPRAPSPERVQPHLPPLNTQLSVGPLPPIGIIPSITPSPGVVVTPVNVTPTVVIGTTPMIGITPSPAVGITPSIGITPSPNITPSPGASPSTVTPSPGVPTPSPSTQLSNAHLSTMSMVSTATDMVVSHIVVEVEGTKEHIAHIVLHIHFEARRKKQIKFDFHMHEDTSDAIASEMVRALNLPEPVHTAQLISQAIESKVEPYRKAWLEHGLCTVEPARPITPPVEIQQQPVYEQVTPQETVSDPYQQQQQQQQPYYPQQSSIPVSPHHGGRRVSYPDAVNGIIQPHQLISPNSSPSQSVRRLEPHQHMPPPYEQHTYNEPTTYHESHHPPSQHTYHVPTTSEQGYYTPASQSQSAHDLHHAQPPHHPHYPPPQQHPYPTHPSSHHHATYASLPQPQTEHHNQPPSYIHASASEPHLPQPYHHHEYDTNYAYNPHHDTHTYPPHGKPYEHSSHATHPQHAHPSHYAPDQHFSSSTSLHGDPNYPSHPAPPTSDPYLDPHYPPYYRSGYAYPPPPHAYTPRVGQSNAPSSKPPSHPSHPHHHTMPRPASALGYDPLVGGHHMDPRHMMKRSDTSRQLPAAASQADLEKEHHDRCYEKYNKLTIAQLKELIKEKDSNSSQYEYVDNKNDLIEIFIKLTPLCATQPGTLKRSESADILSLKQAHSSHAIISPQEDMHPPTRPNLSRDGSVSPPDNGSPRAHTYPHPNGHHYSSQPLPPHPQHPGHAMAHPSQHSYPPPNGYYPPTGGSTPQHYSTHDLYSNGTPPPGRRADSPIQSHQHPHVHPSHPSHPSHQHDGGAYVTYPDLQSGGDMLGHVVHDGLPPTHQPSPSSQQPYHPQQHPHHLPASASHPQGYPPKPNFPHSASSQHLAVPEYSPHTTQRALSPGAYLTPSTSTSNFQEYEEHHGHYSSRNGYPPQPYSHYPPPPQHGYPPQSYHYPPQHGYPQHLHHGHSSSNLLQPQTPYPPTSNYSQYPPSQHTYQHPPQPQSSPPSQTSSMMPPPAQPSPPTVQQSSPHPQPQPQQQQQQPVPSQPQHPPTHTGISTPPVDLNGIHTKPSPQLSPKANTSVASSRRGSHVNDQHSHSSHHLDTQSSTHPTPSHSRSATMTHDMEMNLTPMDLAKKLEKEKIKAAEKIAVKEKQRAEASKAEASILASFSLT